MMYTAGRLPDILSSSLSVDACRRQQFFSNVPIQIDVIPAKAGIHFAFNSPQWIPAFAGMTPPFE
jgi:hypothetical protein